MLRFNLSHKLAPEDEWLKCPHCGNHLNGYTSTAGPEDKPSDNDLSICLYCASVNRYKLEKGRLVIVAMSDQEIQKLPKKELKLIMKAVAGVKNPIIIKLK